MIRSDFVIIGGGVIGLCLAIELKKRYPGQSIVVLEKEQDLAFHASGRNSGVLHAGFYYSADSLKAKFTKEGNRRWREYCFQKKIPINDCGKLVVAKDEKEWAGLDELMRRGKANSIDLVKMTEEEAKKIEPHVKTCGRALFSPTTASVNPRQVMAAVAEDAKQLGIQIQYQTRYLFSQGSRGILTNKGWIEAGYIINAAGLYADKIAKDFGFGGRYEIIPFKGLYLYSNESPGSVRTNIYPVPDLGYPFLGVHFTVTVDGKAKIGPTAIPAFWREQYKALERFQLDEFFQIVGRQLKLFFSNDFNFRKLAVKELQKYHKAHLVSLAASMLTGVEATSYTHWGPAGIRAQLYDKEKRKLEMDFCFEGDGRSFHVLNAVSPAFTCALPFVSFLADEIQKKSRR